MAKPLPYRTFRSIYSRVPRLAIELVIKGESGVVLTLRRSHGWEGMWHMPGVTLLYRETVQQAIVRAAREETGLRIRPQKLLGFLEYPSEEKERGFGTAVGLVFLCVAVSGRLRPDADAADIRIFRKLPKNVIREQRPILEQVLRQKF